MSGGLNMQALHHVLPGVCSCHLTALYPRFEQICAKHNVTICKRRGLWHAVRTSVAHVVQVN